MIKPILFNTEMVRAILSGRKTETRRPIKNQPWVSMQGTEFECNHAKGFFDTGSNNWACRQCGHGIQSNGNSLFTAKYLVGDILYVRETWCDRWLPDGFLIGANRYGYKANGIPDYGYWGNDKQCKDNVWIPSVYMPKDAARLFLKVTSVKVERLKDMPHDAPGKEGIRSFTKDGKVHKFWHKDCDIPWSKMPRSPEVAFNMIWDLTYKYYQSSSNPWVFVYEFEVCDKPSE